MTSFGLNVAECELICSVLKRHTEVTEAKIFGSRAKGTFRPSSDIDLALWGNLSRKTVSSIAQDLEELPLPYKFDVEAYESIGHQELKEHIDRCGTLLYSSVAEIATIAGA